MNSTDFSNLETPSVDPYHLIKSIEIVSSESQNIFLGNGTKLLEVLAKFGKDLDKTDTQTFEEIRNQETNENVQVREIIKMYNTLGKDAEIPIDINPRHIPLNPFPNHDIVDGYHSTL